MQTIQKNFISCDKESVCYLEWHNNSMQAAACNKDDAASHNVARSSLASPGNIICKEESLGARRFSSLHHAAGAAVMEKDLVVNQCAAVIQ